MALNFAKVEFVRSAANRSGFLRDGRPQFAFAGRSNVGKSSVINRLVGRKNLAYVGASPGKTTQINYFLVDQGAYLVDLPGYGYAKVSAAERQRWDDLINRYFETGRDYTLLIQLVDSRREPTEDDFQMMEYLRHHRIPFVVALTKCDKLKKSEMAKQEEMLRELCAPYGCRDVILTSAENGFGIDALKAAIEAAVTGE